MSYTIIENGRAITCGKCGMTSHHPGDVENRYCGNCHEFHELPPGEPPPPSRIGTLSTAANIIVVTALMKRLRVAFDDFISTYPGPVSRVDGFMGAHNFHKLILSEIANDEKMAGEPRRLFFESAAVTFALAMKELGEQPQAKPPATPPAPPAGAVLATTERLALALLEEGLPAMAELARTGYYDDFKSNLVDPLLKLCEDLEAAPGDHMALTMRVVNGEFDSTAAESEAWAKSPEGQATYRELLSRPEKPE